MHLNCSAANKRLTDFLVSSCRSHFCSCFRCWPRPLTPRTPTIRRSADRHLERNRKNSGVWIDSGYVGYLREFWGNKKMSLSPGQHELTVRKFGYKPFTQKFQIDSGKTYYLPIHLELESRRNTPLRRSPISGSMSACRRRRTHRRRLRRLCPANRRPFQNKDSSRSGRQTQYSHRDAGLQSVRNVIGTHCRREIRNPHCPVQGRSGAGRFPAHHPGRDP